MDRNGAVQRWLQYRAELALSHFLTCWDPECVARHHGIRGGAGDALLCPQWFHLHISALVLQAE